ncbi:hypothetical protein PM082_016146 [Marasmius tenuissimus]|nr:hypothetical protein PM082_016146 [Marasmius tenuissimus]
MPQRQKRVRPCSICSVPCYKQHKESLCKPGEQSSDARSFTAPQEESETSMTQLPKPLGGNEDEPLEESKPLKPLSSLRWPYVPEEPAYPDPLTRDDPKPLQIRHYEAIATSEAVRKILEENPNLPGLLRSIDGLKGADRESALQQALGVQVPSIGDNTTKKEVDEDVLALRAFAEAIETAVRGERAGALGLDWGD